MKIFGTVIIFLVTFALSALYVQTGTAQTDEITLHSFVPVSETTWWAVTNKEVGVLGYPIIRTADGGQSWQDVTPEAARGKGLDGFFLDDDTGWVWQEPHVQSPAYRTMDGGHTWVPVELLPSLNCEIDFVDLVYGWCPEINAAAGSEGVELYRTVDGGATWNLVSRTSGVGEVLDTPDNIPFWCNGWNPSHPFPLYATTDGGSHWRARNLPLPLCRLDGPDAAIAPETNLGKPVVKASAVALLMRMGCDDGTGAGVATSDDGGMTWTTHSVPAELPDFDARKGVALADPTHWRFSVGKIFLTTEDVGAHWQRWALPESLQDRQLDLTFLSPLLGWAVNGGDVWQTKDGGRTWTSVTIAVPPRNSTP